MSRIDFDDLGGVVPYDGQTARRPGDVNAQLAGLDSSTGQGWGAR